MENRNFADLFSLTVLRDVICLHILAMRKNNYELQREKELSTFKCERKHTQNEPNEIKMV